MVHSQSGLAVLSDSPSIQSDARWSGVVVCMHSFRHTSHVHPTRTGVEHVRACSRCDWLCSDVARGRCSFLQCVHKWFRRGESTAGSTPEYRAASVMSMYCNKTQILGDPIGLVCSWRLSRKSSPWYVHQAFHNMKAQEDRMQFWLLTLWLWSWE